MKNTLLVIVALLVGGCAIKPVKELTLRENVTESLKNSPIRKQKLVAQCGVRLLLNLER